jgi:thymidylate kinase
MTRTKPLGAAIDDYNVNIIENIKYWLESGKDVVMDRSYISEYVYGSVLRGKPILSFSHVADLWTELKPKYYICLHDHGLDFAVDFHNRNLDKAHPYQDEEYRQIYKCYSRLVGEKFFGSKPIESVMFDPKLDPTENFTKFLESIEL